MVFITDYPISPANRSLALCFVIVSKRRCIVHQFLVEIAHATGQLCRRQKRRSENSRLYQWHFLSSIILVGLGSTLDNMNFVRTLIHYYHNTDARLKLDQFPIPSQSKDQFLNLQSMFQWPTRMDEWGQPNRLTMSQFSKLANTSQGPQYLSCVTRVWLWGDNWFPSYMLSVLSVELRAHQLYPQQRGKTSPKRMSWEWWGSSSGDLESIKYTFIAITPWSTLIRSKSTC